jgi:hypothetical protein
MVRDGDAQWLHVPDLLGRDLRRLCGFDGGQSEGASLKLGNHKNRRANP